MPFASLPAQRCGGASAADSQGAAGAAHPLPASLGAAVPRRVQLRTRVTPRADMCYT
jgi:hypothetical protein